MKKIIILLTFIITTPAFAKNDYEYLLSIINNELSEVARLNKQINASDDTLLLRMAELYLERGRVKKEQENEKFLAIPTNERRKINKRNYFQASKEDMENANKIGLFILKKFKQTKVKGDVFYVFAFYAQEYQSLEKAKEYFNLAKKNSDNQSNSYKKSSLALADIYYNEKNFKAAISNYENAIDDKESKWWTRDAYNLAWCYFREGMKKKGISLMTEVNQLSKKGFYLDFSVESQRDVVYFLVDSGDVKEAENFVKRNGEKPEQLIKLAKNLIDQGKGSNAIYFLNRARKKVEGKADLAEINNLLLDLHEKFSSTADHLEISKSQHQLFLEKQLDEILIKNFEFHLAKMTSKIQEKIKSRTYQNNKKTEQQLGEQHFQYILIIKDVLNTKYSDFLYYQAEIDYMIGNFNKAAERYFEVLNTKNRRVKKLKILSNLLACMGELDKNSNFYQENAQAIYEGFISEEKNIKNKKTVYPLLFTIYLKKGLVNSAEKILFGYNKFFKNEMKIIESMLANLLEHPEIKNDKERFLSFVKKINEKEFIISKQLASSIKNNALTLQFKGVQSESSKGAKSNALRGYKLIYDDSLSSNEARKNAAFNIAVLFYELKYPTKTAEWILKSLELMETSDAKKLFGQVRKISLDLYNLGKESESLEILNKLAMLSCEDSKEFRSLATDYFIQYLISGKSPRISSANFFKCIKDKGFYSELIFKSYEFFYIAGDYEFIFRLLTKSLSETLLTNEKELEIAKLIAIHYESKIPANSLKIIKLVEKKYAGKYSGNIFYKELQALERKFEYKSISQRIFRNKLSFPEDKFNRLLKQRIDQLSKLSQMIVSDPEKGGVIFISPIYEILFDSYSQLIDEINSFVPEGKGGDYVNGFKKSMNSLVSNLESQRNELRENLKKIVTIKEIITDSTIDRTMDLPKGNLKKLEVESWAISDRGN